MNGEGIGVSVENPIFDAVKSLGLDVPSFETEGLAALDTEQIRILHGYVMGRHFLKDVRNRTGKVLASGCIIWEEQPMDIFADAMIRRAGIAIPDDTQVKRFTLHSEEGASVSFESLVNEIHGLPFGVQDPKVGYSKRNVILAIHDYVDFMESIAREDLGNISFWGITHNDLAEIMTTRLGFKYASHLTIDANVASEAQQIQRQIVTTEGKKVVFASLEDMLNESVQSDMMRSRDIADRLLERMGYESIDDLRRESIVEILTSNI